MDFLEPLRAFIWGFLSAASMPLGAAIALRFTPSHRWTSSMMAFGAGALMAALAFELVAHSLHSAGFWVMAAGFLGGSLLYVGLNKILNGQGGFLRSESTTIVYLTEKKRALTENLLDRLSRVDILRTLPPDEVESVVPLARPAALKAGETAFLQGEPGDRLYIIDEGQAEILVAREGGAPHQVAVLGPGDTFGEMALLTGDRRSATVRAVTDLKLWTLAHEDFQRLVQASPRLRGAVQSLLQRRLEARVERSAAEAGEVRAWAKAAKASVSAGDLAPNSEDILRAQRETGGAPLAIWLGILMDGVPESLVIGASMLGGSSVNPALFFGVFLADFPEAMSSAAGMLRQGYSKAKVMVMWTSIALMMGVGAAIGILTFGNVPVTVHALMEALAAGAMLTVIAETMLPEAVEKGGAAIGVTTVLGFLAAVYTTTLSH